MTIGIEQLRQANVDTVIEGADNRRHHRAFEDACKTVKDTDQALYEIYALMSGITSMRLDPANRQTPYRTGYPGSECRGLIPDDIDEDTLTVLSGFAGELKNSQLAARILDVCWLRLRNPDIGHQAVAAYIKAADETFDPQHWPLCADIMERALALSAIFARRDRSYLNAVVKHIEQVIDRLDGSDPLFLSLRLIEKLSNYSDERADDYYSLSVRIAESAIQEPNWHKAVEAWRVAGILAKSLKDDEKVIFTHKELAETYAKQADACSPDMAASHWMQKAVEAYKKVPGEDARKSELYAKLREYQKATVESMSAIEGPRTDITEMIERATQIVSGHSFEDALFHFCFSLTRPLDFTRLKERAIADSEKYVFRHLVSTVRYDRQGLVAAQVPPLSGLADSEKDKALWFSMLQSVDIEHLFKIQAYIDPARREILLEHNVRESSFYPILQHNPLIPEGHEVIFAKALNFGFQGDFISCTHLMVPQLEAALRHALQSNGVEPTTLNTHGVQEHIRLSAILNHDVFVRVFGKDASLELQAILIDRKYANLRNELSHGLMRSNDFHTIVPVYLWWFVMRLCLVPYYSDWNSEQNEENTSETND